MVERWNRGGERAKHLGKNKRKRDGLPVERLMVKYCIRVGGTLEQRWWNSRTSSAGRVKHLMMEQWNNHDGTVEALKVEQWNM